ncbi:uncharacterized protein LOC106132637 [Amyelois transitella]|uniref:uncharacterized protein LOC106132637 n=1 Tax=Amyelois transitella TaxID=680683 RepID=UPI00067CC4D8|nr:uncharacterized protein LOC106132637 [Amyelois transitella]
MEFRVTIFVCAFLAVVSALPDDRNLREKRDVMESIKNAWGEMVRTLSDAGDAVVHVFKPTEKSVIDKMADGVKGLTQ